MGLCSLSVQLDKYITVTSWQRHKGLVRWELPWGSRGHSWLDLESTWKILKVLTGGSESHSSSEAWGASVQMCLLVAGGGLAQVTCDIKIYRTSSCNFVYPARSTSVEVLFTHALIRMVLPEWCSAQPVHLQTAAMLSPASFFFMSPPLLSWGWM